ncbi:MAG: tripartite tricarboxylate transporter substrate binding protein [Betaproteobacteria bacterium]|nr:tripartite tricarboxylate transporter substrate binding protein [Betaproteobacteria bacterium]
MAKDPKASRRRVRPRLAAALLAIFASGAPLAQDYPNRPIRMITPTGAGGVSDGLSRMVAQGLSELLRQPMVVENRAGAMTQIGNEYVSRAAPDGYTILWGAVDMTMLPVLRKSAANFDAVRDLSPIALAVSTWGAYAVTAKFPAESLKEFVALAKAKPDTIRYGTNGIGGSLHLAAEMLAINVGIKLVHVPYKAIAQAVTDVISGEVEMASLAISTAAANRGRLRLLAQAGPTRHPMIPDVPTTAELGMPEVSVVFWFGLFAPPGTPRPIVERIARELDTVLRNPGFRDRLGKMGTDATYLPPAAFAKLIVDDQKKWAKFIPAMGIVPE